MTEKQKLCMKGNIVIEKDGKKIDLSTFRNGVELYVDELDEIERIHVKDHLLPADLIEINKSTRCVVQMTLTTFDEELCRIVEPNVCTTKRRIEVLEEMHKRGIPTVVWLTPILPFINDTKENINAILEECIRVGVNGILCFDMGLTLREGDREYYYAALDKHFPGMKRRYIEKYGNSYVLSSPHAEELMSLFRNVCKTHGILYTRMPVLSF